MPLGQWFHTIRLRLRSLFRRQQLERELDEELAYHVAEKTEEYRSQGLSTAEARRRAVLDMQGIERSKEECRETRKVNWLHDLFQDLRHGLRMLGKNPGFAVAAVLTLALGIGANTAIFAVMQGVIFRPLPYPEANRLVMLRTDTPSNPNWPAISYPEYQFLAENSSTLAGLGGIRPNYAEVLTMELDITEGEHRERVQTAEVTPDLLPVLGVSPILGRSVDWRDRHPETNNRIATLISYDLWQRQFDGDPDVVGKLIGVEYTRLEVVGVLPRNFQLHLGPDTGVIPRIDLWFVVYRATTPDDRYLRTIGRLAPGVSLQQAQAEIDSLIPRLRLQFPGQYREPEFSFRLVPLQSDLTADARPVLWILCGAVGLVLVIACANVANLLIARAQKRASEIALRKALGASLGRIFRQLLAENLLIALLGGAGGILFAYQGVALLLLLKPRNLPRLESVSVSLDVLFLALGLSFLTGVLLALAPIGQLYRVQLSPALREGGRNSAGSRMRSRGLLVGSQVAFSVVLLVGTGLMLRTFLNLKSVDRGFDSKNVLVFKVPFDHRKLTLQGNQRWEYHKEVLAKLRAIPGIQTVGGVFVLPTEGMSRGFAIDSYATEDQPGGAAQRVASFNVVFPGYFQTLRIPVLAGRVFSQADETDSRLLIVVCDQLAETAWPGENPLGKKLLIRFANQDNRNEWAEVIGMVKHVHQDDLTRIGHPQVYVPYWRKPYFGIHFTVRTVGPPLAVVPAIRAAADTVPEAQFVNSVRTMDAVVAAETADSDFALTLLGILSALAIAIASVGIYAVLSYTVNCRVAEIGIRMALGAERRHILQTVLGSSIFWVFMGLASGLAAALLLTRFLEPLLFAVSPLDPYTFVAVSLLLPCVGLLACYVPTRRAIRVDLVTALRHE